jgi:hypothetical protein
VGRFALSAARGAAGLLTHVKGLARICHLNVINTANQFHSAVTREKLINNILLKIPRPLWNFWTFITVFTAARRWPL